jgi:amino acid permease-associated region
VVSSRIRLPVFEAIWLGHPLVNGLRMARLEDDADISGAVVRERR